MTIIKTQMIKLISYQKINLIFQNRIHVLFSNHIHFMVKFFIIINKKINIQNLKFKKL